MATDHLMIASIAILLVSQSNLDAIPKALLRRKKKDHNMRFPGIKQDTFSLSNLSTHVNQLAKSHFIMYWKENST